MEKYENRQAAWKDRIPETVIGNSKENSKKKWQYELRIDIRR